MDLIQHRSPVRPLHVSWMRVAARERSVVEMELRRYAQGHLRAPVTDVALTAEGVPLQYAFNFYLNYLAKWPEYCQMAVGPGQNNMGYGAHAKSVPGHARQPAAMLTSASSNQE